MQYTVYSLYPSELGDPVEQADCDRMNRLLQEEVRRAHLDTRARVIVTEEAGRYTLGIPGWDSELAAAVDAAWQRFLAES